MSALDALLNPAYSEVKKTITLGDRLIDPETGEPAKFVLRSLTQDEKSAIRKRSIVTKELDGTKYNEVDNDLFLARCLVECIVEPDLKNAKLGERYGSVAPDVVLKKMFLAPEYDKLAKAFMDLNVGDGEADGGEVTKK